MLAAKTLVSSQSASLLIYYWPASVYEGQRADPLPWRQGRDRFFVVLSFE